MRRPTDAHPELTEADRTSQTRFGPRPVPKGHHTASPYKHRKMVSSKIPPSGRVSPDGRHAWPEPSLSAKIIVWGGIALGVAGVTAATALAARKLVQADDPAPARPYRPGGAVHAPRFADLDEAEKERVRSRVRAQARDDARKTAGLRAAAGARRGGSGNFAKDLTKTATDLSEGLNGVAQSLQAAFHSFRGVSQQASTIVGDFVVAADQLRAILNRTPGPEPVAPGSRMPDQAGTDQAGRDRSHRL